MSREGNDRTYVIIIFTTIGKVFLPFGLIQSTLKVSMSINRRESFKQKRQTSKGDLRSVVQNISVVNGQMQ
jgi:hypothetical protein